ncbi:hypothetical protein [Kangiella sediminilitoris]|uniref:DUF2846 domain-containing protein n=1 Tax=Kangiella sediminilitoris TaxID=1144748 RepID=A0A1B3BBP2_9GAMM|nr:hypothetical protein [Kangiella sediminilitoris]AOE50213.1 hypothetical protein KS2013_1501 [Kangiella sediminilitoris]
MKRIIALAMVIAIAFLSGCTTKLQNFSNNQKLEPDNSNGIVVIAYESDTAIYSLTFSGPGNYELEHTLYDDNHNFVVTSIPAGTYDITKVKIISKYQYIPLGTNEKANWKVNIEPNKINYIGHFNIENVGRGFIVQIKNSSTIAMEFLQKNFPDLLARYQLTYSKDGPEDAFFDYINKLQGGK